MPTTGGPSRHTGVMADRSVGRIDGRRCNALLIKAVIAPVMQSGFEDEGCAGWDESDPRGPAAQSGLAGRLPLLCLFYFTFFSFIPV